MGFWLRVNTFLLRKTKMQILKFSAEWCNPCKQLSKLLEKLDIDVIEKDIDLEENQDLLTKYKIRSVPTLVAVKDDIVEGVISGSVSESRLRDWLAIVG